MPLPIAPVTLPIPPVVATPVAPSPVGVPFQTVLTQAISQVEQVGANAEASLGRFLSGEGEELHQVAIQSAQAELSFELFMQVRNKVVAAYQEVMRMQI